MPPRGVPDQVARAISCGWSGMAVLDPDPSVVQPVTVVVCATTEALRWMANDDLRVAVSQLSHDTRRPIVGLGIGQAPQSMEVAIDLGFAAGRAIVRRMVDAGCVRVLRAPVDGHDASWDLVRVGSATRRVLSLAVSRAAEWHTTEPLPLGLSPERWQHASRKAPCLLEGAPGGTVMLLVPDCVLHATHGAPGHVEVALPDRCGSLGCPYVEFRFVDVRERGHVVRAVPIDLSDHDQCRLARRLLNQMLIEVLGVREQDSKPGSSVRIVLSPACRQLIERAVRATDTRGG